MRREEMVRRLFFALNPTVVLAEQTEIPETLMEKIKEARLLEFAKLMNGEKVEEASDAEVVAYLHTASLMVPFNDTFANIYVILTQKVLGVRISNLEYRDLTEGEKYELKKLKQWIFRQREKREKERAKELRDLFKKIAEQLPKSIDPRQKTLAEVMTE